MTARDEFLITDYWPTHIAQAERLGAKYASKKAWGELLNIASAKAFGCHVHIQPNFVKSGKSGIVAQAEHNGFPLEGFKAIFKNLKAWRAAECFVECEDLLDAKLAELTAG